ncbi:MAG: DUF2029 domain-containing protein [Candidatus Obscuribacterales bacterium]|nr:DUF2029 domain-containing protein [Candidatus Obscuribacterales bacterium]
MKRTLCLIASAWGFILVLLFIYTDLQMPKEVSNSDYLMTYHTAGQLVREGNARMLYPPPDANSFIDTEFDKAAHRILPLLPARATAEFMYMPLIAGLFVPFSFLPLGYSILAWQILSLVAVAFSAFLISSHASQTEEGSNLDIAAGWIALTLIPLALSIWIGQLSVIYGLLPLMGGLYFVFKRKDTLGGLVWSLAVLKPQFFIPAVMMTIGLAAAKRFKPIIGIACGIIAIVAINLILFSPDMFREWLTTVKLADAVYSDTKFGVNTQLATSLPRAIILLLPVEQHAVFKPLVYAISVILGGIGLLFVSRLIRSTLPDSFKISLAAIICVFATPMVVPHVFFYDFTIFAAAGFLACAFKWPEYLDWRIRSLTYVTWSLINIYAVILVTKKSFAIPIVFVLLMLELYRRALMIGHAALKHGVSANAESTKVTDS